MAFGALQEGRESERCRGRAFLLAETKCRRDEQAMALRGEPFATLAFVSLDTFDADGAEGPCVPAVPKSQRVLARTLEQTDGYVIGHGRARCRDLCAVEMGLFSAPIARAQGAHGEIQMTREVHPGGKDHGEGATCNTDFVHFSILRPFPPAAAPPRQS